MSRINRPPISLSRITRHIGDKDVLSKPIVVVGAVTDDIRLTDDLKKMTVAALKFTSSARARIENAGGSCLTFDQLALKYPTGSGCTLLRGPKDREAEKHFGPAPGTPGSHTK